MATSGVYHDTLTLNTAIQEALDLLGIGVDGEELPGSAYARGKASANLMLKAWKTAGLQLWLQKEGTLFLRVGQSEYDFRDSSTKAANEWWDTEASADITAGDLSFTVDNISNIQKDDIIGVIQSSDNDLFWTTVRRINGSTVFVDDQLPACDEGAKVYNYRCDDDALIPISRITDVRRREDTDYEIPIIFESRRDYFNLPNKNQNGTVIQAHYARQDVTGERGGIMYVWNPPNSAKPVLNFTYERKIQVMVNADDTIDIPDYAQEAFVTGLADRLKKKYGGISPQKAAEIKQDAQDAFDDMLSYDNSVYPLTLDMGLDAYR